MIPGRHLAVMLVVLGTRQVSLSQTETPTDLARSAIYLELFGQGGLYSINYEYRFLKNFSARVGFSKWVFPFLIANVDFTGFPLMVNLLIGGRYANLEVGAGVIVVSASATTFFSDKTGSTGPLAIATGTLGYRHQSVDGGFVFRVGLTPVYLEGELLPAFGLSFGHSF
jgi:hypothetical protein